MNPKFQPLHVSREKPVSEFAFLEMQRAPLLHGRLIHPINLEQDPGAAKRIKARGCTRSRMQL
jgi:hypothetical protein